MLKANFKNSRKFRNYFKIILRATWYLILGSLTYHIFLYFKCKGRENKPPKNPSNEFLFMEPFYKFILMVVNLKDMIKKTMVSPYYHKLIPDSMVPGQKTLVLDLNKTIISYTYKMGKGFEIIKRPGLNKFLMEMSNYYEIVFFGIEDSGVS